MVRNVADKTALVLTFDKIIFNPGPFTPIRFSFNE